MSYRGDMQEVHKEAWWTFRKFALLFVAVVVFLSVVGFGLKSVGLIGSTVVEREVFERSYQRTESIKAQIATDEAVLVEIQRKLTNANLEPSTIINLEAQASATRVRIAAAKGRLQ